MESSSAYNKNTVEFVTVAAEYCAFMERMGEREADSTIDVLCKLLPLVYIKAAMLPDSEPEGL